jgi:hypothetical protein
MDQGNWDQPRLHVAGSKTLSELRRRLLFHAERLGAELIDRKRMQTERSPQRRRRRLDEWKLLGVDVETSDMPSSGASRFDELQRLVLVRAADPPQRQRFTVAHEIGHFFLSAAPTDKVQVTHALEEALCDEFASRLLLPPTELGKAIQQIGSDVSIEDLLSLCRHFEVGIQPMLIALRDVLKAGHPIFLAASYRGHPLRSDVKDYRIDVVAHPPVLYVAKDQRLSSIGLCSVTEWAEGVASAKRGEGRSPALRIKLWDRDRHRSGLATGGAEWQATRLANTGVLLVRITLVDLKIKWAPGRRT